MAFQEMEFVNVQSNRLRENSQGKGGFRHADEPFDH